MPEFKFNLGDEVKDTITGFPGVVICRSQWLNNCNTYTVQSKKLKDGAPQTGQAFDEPQLTLLKEKQVKTHQKTGGPIREVRRPGIDV